MPMAIPPGRMLRRVEMRLFGGSAWASWTWPVVGAVLLHWAVLHGTLPVNDRALKPSTPALAVTLVPISLARPLPTHEPADAALPADKALSAPEPAPPRTPPRASPPQLPAPTLHEAPRALDAAAQGEQQLPTATGPASQEAWESEPSEPARAFDVRAVPSYRAEVPESFAQALKVHREATARPWSAGTGERPTDGAGELRFERDGAGAYALHLNLGLGSRPLLEMHSQGRLGALGLEPERLTDRRRGRSRSAANLDRQAQLARFSGGAAESPLAEAAQDRLTWMLQLPAIVRADPSLQRPGAQLWLHVVGARGGSQIWRFEAIGQETLLRPDGTSVAGAWRWRRQAELPYDLEVDVWLGGADAALPALVRLTPRPGGAALSFWPFPTP